MLSKLYFNSKLYYFNTPIFWKKFDLSIFDFLKIYPIFVETFVFSCSHILLHFSYKFILILRKVKRKFNISIKNKHGHSVLILLFVHPRFCYIIIIYYISSFLFNICDGPNPSRKSRNRTTVKERIIGEK